WWTPAAVKCFKTNGDVKIVVFGVDSADAYAAAAALGIDAVMTDSPHAMRIEKKLQ
ncbi:MAG: glycerophosphoryl diester phosphodiesterase, partial [Caballeronia sp.]|nr:glycerophosphoryl diester phosphodiesterase [Caballeronia sp.]